MALSQFSRLYPLLNMAAKPLVGRCSLANLAIETEQVHPPETTTLPPVVMLEGDWEKVTQVQGETSWEAEKLRAFGGVHQHQATVRYTYKNVLATPWGCYMLGRSFLQSGRARIRQLMSARVTHRAQGYFGLPVIGMKYFGHWLRDGLPCSLLRREGEALYFPVDPSWPHAQGYCDFLQIDRLTEPLVFFDRLTIGADVGQNAHRRARMQQIQAALHARLPAQSAPGVFIRRGRTGAARTLLNEDEVARAMQARGFNICSASDDLETILAACAHVDTVVTVEGSHWAHGFFAAKRGAAHVTLNPSDRFNNQYAAYMPALDQRLATLVITPHEGGYLADLERLERLMDKAGVAPRTPA